jgi:hypothetical protein
MSDAQESRGRVIVLLVLIFALGAAIGLLFVVPSSLSRFLGACLVAIGAFNVLLHRRFGSETSQRGQSMPFVSNLWKGIGKEGAQLLYLGIGIIYAAAGVFLLTESMWKDGAR